MARIYLEPSTGMVNLDDDSGNPISSEPQSSLSVFISGGKIGIRYTGVRGQNFLELSAPEDVKDSTGAYYSTTLKGTRAALNVFLADAPSEYLDAWGGWGNSKGIYNNGQFVNKATSVASTAFAPNSFYFFPVMMSGKVDELMYIINFLSAGRLSVGLYGSDANNLPLNKIWQGAEQTTTGQKIAPSLGLKLKRGLYWFAVLVDSINIALVSSGSVAMLNLLGLNSTGTAQFTHRLVTGAYPYRATLPDLAPASTLATSFIVPMLNFKEY